jgi:hypothetical protein
MSDGVPPFNVLLKVSGSWAWGVWVVEARAVEYKKGSTKAQLKRRYRWIDKDGAIVDHVEKWTHKD